jgi:hypothetical protein
MRTSALLLVTLVAACTRGSPPAPPAPVPPSPRSAPVPPPIPSVTFYPDIPFCVVRDGHLESVDVQVSFKGDSVWRGTPIAQAFPTDSTYAGNARWYLEREPISVAGGLYVMYGLPRILATTDVVPAATFRGVTVFAEPRDDLRRPEVIYVPTRPGCEFQPYQRAGIK